MAEAKDILVRDIILGIDNMSAISKNSYKNTNKRIAEIIKLFIETRLTLIGIYSGVLSGGAPDGLSGPKVFLVDTMPITGDDLDNVVQYKEPLGAAGQHWLNVIGKSIANTKFKTTDSLNTIRLSTPAQLSIQMSGVMYQQPISIPWISEKAVPQKPIPGVPDNSIPNEIYVKLGKLAIKMQNEIELQKILNKFKSVVPEKTADWYKNNVQMYGIYDLIFSRIVDCISLAVFTMPAQTTSIAIGTGITTYTNVKFLST